MRNNLIERMIDIINRSAVLINEYYEMAKKLEIENTKILEDNLKITDDIKKLDLDKILEELNKINPTEINSKIDKNTKKVNEIDFKVSNNLKNIWSNLDDALKKINNFIDKDATNIKKQVKDLNDKIDKLDLSEIEDKLNEIDIENIKKTIDGRIKTYMLNYHKNEFNLNWRKLPNIHNLKDGNFYLLVNTYHITILNGRWEIPRFAKIFKYNNRGFIDVIPSVNVTGSRYNFLLMYGGLNKIASGDTLRIVDLFKIEGNANISDTETIQLTDIKSIECYVYDGNDWPVMTVGGRDLSVKDPNLP